MGNLICLSTARGKIRIMDKSAVKYRDIGAVLLNADDVSNIEMTARGVPVESVRMIYQEWMRKDEHASWKKLTECFRTVELNALARDIEQHFGLPSPRGQGEETRVAQQDQPSPPEQNGDGEMELQGYISLGESSTLKRRGGQEHSLPQQNDNHHRASERKVQRAASCGWRCAFPILIFMVVVVFCLYCYCHYHK
jgi:hypothetical protein